MVAITSVGAPSVPLASASLANPEAVKDAAPANAALQASAQDTPYAQNKDKFLGLAKTILNADGKFSLEDRLKAFSSFWGMVANGDVFGGDKEYQDLSDQIYAADFNQRAEHLGNQDMVTMSIARAQGKSTSAKGLQWFASLTEDDQKIYYYANQNGLRSPGQYQYASFEAYRDQCVKIAVSETICRGDNPALAEALKAIGPAKAGSDWSAQVLSALQVSAATDKGSGETAENSKFSELAEALKVLETSKSSPDWDAHVLSLFKTMSFKDVDPDPVPDRFLPTNKPSLPDSYKPGNLRYQTV
jgi:hypothetical protein